MTRRHNNYAVISVSKSRLRGLGHDILQPKLSNKHLPAVLKICLGSVNYNP